MCHSDKLSLLRSNGVCINCLRPGHYTRSCKSLHKRRACQRHHYTLLHIEEKNTPPVGTTLDTADSATPSGSSAQNSDSTLIATTGIRSDILMTCRVVVKSSHGSKMEARALLDSGSSVSFVSQRLAQCLHLPHSSNLQGSLESPVLQVTVIILPCLGPTQSVSFRETPVDVLAEASKTARTVVLDCLTTTSIGR